MQFRDLLQTNVIDEWKDQYIDFDELLSEIILLKGNVFGNEDTTYSRGNTCCICCKKSYHESIDIQHFVDIHNKKTTDMMALTELKNNIDPLQDKLLDNANENMIDMDEKSDKINIINQWKSIINDEANKINNFYVSVEQELFNEYTVICNRLDKLHHKYQLKQSKLNNNNNNVSSTSLSDIEYDSQLTDSINSSNSNPSLLLRKGSLNISKSKQSKDIYLQQMKINIFVLYQRFVVLSNYSTLNQIGFKSIIDKFNKELKIKNNNNNIMEICVNKLDFVCSNKCMECMNGLIKSYANIYENGNYNNGKIRLLNSISWSNSKNKWLNNEKSIFWIGTKFGIMIGLILWILLTFIFADSIDVDVPQNVVYIYRCLGVIIALLWFWSFDIYIFSNKRINYVFIFELNPKTRLTFLEYFDIATTMTIIYFLDVAFYLETLQKFGNHYSTIWPTALFIFFILRLVLPIFDYWSSRKLILNSIFQCIIAPFGVVGFADFFMGDVLTSFSKVFVDIYFSGCIILLNEYQNSNSVCINSRFSLIMKPILICSPYWFRFMQCINRYYITGKRKSNGFNALKYGLSLSVTLLGAFHSSYSKADFDGDEDDVFDVGRVIWLLTTLMSTLYLIFWDLKMDWDLFPFKKRIKSYPIFWYYIAVVNDIILRFFWTFTLFPSTANPYFDTGHHIISHNAFLAFIEIAEVFRRACWAIFRVEKAHISQQDEFRKYQYIPLFYENNTLIANKQPKSKPATMIMEVIAIFIILVVIAIIIVITK